MSDPVIPLPADKPLSTPVPRGCTNFKTRQFARVLSRHYDAALTPTALKITQYSLLTHLVHLGEVNPGVLAERMGLDPSTLTRNLRPMLTAGWIVQQAGRDARCRRVALTDAGREKQAEAARLWKSAQQSVNRLLGAEHVIALHDLLDECTARLRAAAPSRQG